ncbi:MAG: ftsB [Burkholderiaceae bacterium]|nr:ftsB [Burkholderiaceae bacterium]
MRRLPLFLFLALCGLLVALAVAWWQLFQTKKAIELQVKQNQELIYRNAALQADIQDLKNGNDAVQERARLQLGMVKKDEVFVQVMDQPSAVQPVPNGNLPAVPTNQPQNPVNERSTVNAPPAKPAQLSTTAPAPTHSAPKPAPR